MELSAAILSAYAIVFIGLRQKKSQPEDGLATQDKSCRRVEEVLNYIARVC
ncbi:hypothetical protein THOG05_60100 [Vibrio rotiferianus]|nr:hypothetical protein THOG05_60100 [Vibrio rotiferianus]CAH1565060.1 hypothetical protein THOE12_20766 [Vibrio rotiferianus]